MKLKRCPACGSIDVEQTLRGEHPPDTNAARRQSCGWGGRVHEMVRESSDEMLSGAAGRIETDPARSQPLDDQYLRRLAGRNRGPSKEGPNLASGYHDSLGRRSETLDGLTDVREAFPRLGPFNPHNSLAERATFHGRYLRLSSRPVPRIAVSIFSEDPLVSVPISYLSIGIRHVVTPV